MLEQFWDFPFALLTQVIEQFGSLHHLVHYVDLAELRRVVLQYAVVEMGVLLREEAYRAHAPPEKLPTDSRFNDVSGQGDPGAAAMRGASWLHTSQVSGFRVFLDVGVWGLRGWEGLRAWGHSLAIPASGRSAQGVGRRVQGLGSKGQGSRVWGPGRGFRVWGLFRVQGLLAVLVGCLPACLPAPAAASTAADLNACYCYCCCCCYMLLLLLLLGCGQRGGLRGGHGAGGMPTQAGGGDAAPQGGASAQVGQADYV